MSRGPSRVVALTVLAMIAFAGNSLLCRLALRGSGIDAVSFTLVRLLAGALTLTAIVALRGGRRGWGGSWASAVALYVYAAGFSWAYLSLSAATGALLLFGAVQVTMISAGLWKGERLAPLQTLGVVAAAAGLVAMLLPGAETPPLHGALLMLAAGVAWGVYSLRGRGAADPTALTAGNFVRATVLAIAVGLVLALTRRVAVSADGPGIAYAVASGALASGVGYAVWYAALRDLSATRAAAVQLTVPVLAALGAVVLLGEPLSWRLAITAAVVLGGVGLVIGRRPARLPGR